MTKMYKLLVAATTAVMLTVVSFAGAADAPTAGAAQADYYLKIEGIDGEIQIESFSWGISTPRDAASGQASGKRQYQPLVIRKQIDKSSPLLFRLANDGKGKIGTVTIVKRAQDGAVDNAYKVVFHDIVIMNFEHKGDIGSQGSESVSFTYQKIQF